MKAWLKYQHYSTPICHGKLFVSQTHHIARATKPVRNISISSQIQTQPGMFSNGYVSIEILSRKSLEWIAGQQPISTTLYNVIVTDVVLLFLQGATALTVDIDSWIRLAKKS